MVCLMSGLCIEIFFMVDKIGELLLLIDGKLMEELFGDEMIFLRDV